ncbi:MAG: hypothetical protein K8T89_16605 [Planctomycetes bacterium]|nr:hypothetical protein [Planctomycetota bacterium]
MTWKKWAWYIVAGLLVTGVIVLVVIPDARKTLWKNAFGSDELGHYTAEYTWLANQMAHAMMGFFIIVCWGSYVFTLQNSTTTVFELRFSRWLRFRRADVLMFWPFLFIILKEIVDVVSDYSKYSDAAVPTGFGNLVLDSVMDISCWYLGMFLALFVLSIFVDGQGYRIPAAIAMLFVCLAVVVWHGKIWINEKRTFDASDLPMNYERLVLITARWEDQATRDTDKLPHPFPDDKKEHQLNLIRDIRKNADSGETTGRKPYVIFGGDPRERTRLAVSLGCEYAFHLRYGDWSPKKEDLVRVVYTTAARAIDLPESISGYAKGKLDCVIINDINVTIDPPLELIVMATERYPALKQHFSPTIKQKFNLLANDETLPPKERILFAKFSGIALPDQQWRLLHNLTGTSADGFDPKIDLRKADLDDTKLALSKAKEKLPPREQKVTEKRNNAFAKIQSALTEAEHSITTIWVLSGLPEDPNEAPDAKETWLYIIAYLTGIDRTELDKNLIEFRPITPAPKPKPISQK